MKRSLFSAPGFPRLQCYPMPCVSEPVQDSVTRQALFPSYCYPSGHLGFRFSATVQSPMVTLLLGFEKRIHISHLPQSLLSFSFSIMVFMLFWFLCFVFCFIWFVLFCFCPLLSFEWDLGKKWCKNLYLTCHINFHKHHFSGSKVFISRCVMFTQLLSSCWAVKWLPIFFSPTKNNAIVSVFVLEVVFAFEIAIIIFKIDFLAI